MANVKQAGVRRLKMAELSPVDSTCRLFVNRLNRPRTGGRKAWRYS